MRLGEPLTEVDGGMAGTLEVFHAGAWGSVCADVITRSARIDGLIIAVGGIPVRPLYT